MLCNGLTNECFKNSGYQRFALEQEVLENFFQFYFDYTENAHKKLMKCLKWLLKYLDLIMRFIELGTDCKEATVLNMYVDDSKRRSFPVILE